MALGHVGLCGDQVAQLVLHLAHRLEQTPAFVGGLRIDIVVELAAGNRFGCAGGTAQRLGQAAGDQQAQRTTEQHHQDGTGDEHLARVIHRLQRTGGRVGRQLVLQRDVLVDLVLPALQCRSGLGQQQGKCFIGMSAQAQFDHLVVEHLGLCAAAVDLVADRLALRVSRHRVERVTCFGVIGARLLELGQELDVLFVAGRQHDIAHLHRNNVVGIHHVVGEPNLGHVRVDDIVDKHARRTQAAVTDKGDGAGEHDQNGKCAGQSWANVVTLQECIHDEGSVRRSEGCVACADDGVVTRSAMCSSGLRLPELNTCVPKTA